MKVSVGININQRRPKKRGEGGTGGAEVVQGQGDFSNTANSGLLVVILEDI
jgi:hypothetical protein